MIRLYAIIFIVALLGGAAYAAKYYYDTTQATIAQLRENNAKLEVANEENQATIKKMDENNKRLNALTDQLNADLRKSEQYGDVQTFSSLHSVGQSVRSTLRYLVSSV